MSMEGSLGLAFDFFLLFLFFLILFLYFSVTSLPWASNSGSSSVLSLSLLLLLLLLESEGGSSSPPPLSLSPEGAKGSRGGGLLPFFLLLSLSFYLFCPYPQNLVQSHSILPPYLKLSFYLHQKSEIVEKKFYNSIWF